MKRFTQSRGYLRLRAILGTTYALFGLIIIARSYTSLGIRFAELPALVLGAALVGLGILRVRDYLTLRKSISA